MKTVFLLSLASRYDDMQIERILLGGPLGIFGPVLVVLMCLWLGRGDRSPWYVKVILIAVLIVLVLILFGGI